MYPDPAARRRAIVVAVISGIFVLAAGLLLHSVVRPWLDQYFGDLEELIVRDPLAAKRSLLNLMAFTFAATGVLAFGIGIWAILRGWQMTKAERWPRPGTKVYYRVKVLGRVSARRRGKVLIGAGLILAVLVPAMGWKAYGAISASFDTLRPNNGLQPTAPSAAGEPSRSASLHPDLL
jgi:hypothetical protein